MENNCLHPYSKKRFITTQGMLNSILWLVSFLNMFQCWLLSHRFFFILKLQLFSKEASYCVFSQLWPQWCNSDITHWINVIPMESLKSMVSHAATKSVCAEPWCVTIVIFKHSNSHKWQQTVSQIKSVLSPNQPWAIFRFRPNSDILVVICCAVWGRC